MGAFEYTALDTGGREKKGILEGDTARQVRQMLREKQLLPVTVTGSCRERIHRAEEVLSLARSAYPPPTSRCSPGSSPRS